MIISRTPMRMSFAGGGSDIRDYYEHGYGLVVSTAIDKFVYINVNKKSTDHIRVGYSQTEHVNNVDEIQHNIVREALKLVGIKKGIDIYYMSDMLPAQEGSGLGGSSSILVGTLHALHACKGEYVSAKTLAQEACRVEIEILRHPIGKQDQYAAAYGGFNHIRFNSDESVLVNPVIMRKEFKEELNRNLMLFYTGMNSRSDTVLTEQKLKTKENRHILDKMVEMAEELKKSIEQEDTTRFASILNEGWLHKKKLASNISNSDIDAYYEKAISAGATGGKILGSGGGGFLLFYCEEKKQDAVRKALPQLKETKFNFEPEGSRIIYVSG